MLLLSSAEFFIINIFKNIIRVSIGLDPDHDRHSVGPDLDPNVICKGYQQMTKVTASARNELKFFHPLIIK